MSVLFSLVAAVARFIPPDIEITRLKAQINALKGERDEARALLKILEEEIASVRRWRIESPPSQMTQAQMAQIMAAQTQNVMLGAQNLNLGYEWCNCVPARHDTFLLSNMP